MSSTRFSPEEDRPNYRFCIPPAAPGQGNLEDREKDLSTCGKDVFVEVARFFTIRFKTAVFQAESDVDHELLSRIGNSDAPRTAREWPREGRQGGCSKNCEKNLRFLLTGSGPIFRCFYQSSEEVDIKSLRWRRQRLNSTSVSGTWGESLRLPPRLLSSDSPGEAKRSLLLAISNSSMELIGFASSRSSTNITKGGRLWPAWFRLTAANSNH